MSTYRTGNHWGVTIVREGERTPERHITGADQLVAVVVNGDHALAERICALLNRDERETRRKPTDCPRCGSDKPCPPNDVCPRCAVEMGWEFGGDVPPSPLSAPVSVQDGPAVPSVTPAGDVSGSEAVHADCDCGHEGLPEQWHLRPCPVAERRVARRQAQLTGVQERADVRRRIAEQAEHRPSSLGDGLGYGPCVGCGQLWPCMASRAEVS